MSDNSTKKVDGESTEQQKFLQKVEQLRQKKEGNSEEKQSPPYLQLVKLFVTTRLLFTFVVIPLLHLVWNKKGEADVGGGDAADSGRGIYDTLVIRPLRLLVSFDAEHFLQIAQYGYTNEKNHAFFPGFPMMLNAVRVFANLGGDTTATTDLINDPIFLKFAYALQLLIGSANTVLIYKLGVKLLSLQLFNGPFKEGVFQLPPTSKVVEQRAHLISYGAALLYVFSQTLVYTISLYSESLFLLGHLLAVYSLHWTCFSCSRTTAVQSGKMFLSFPFLTICCMTRSTGGIITIVPIYYTVHKIARNLWGKPARKYLDKLEQPQKADDEIIIVKVLKFVFGSLYSIFKGVKYFVLLLLLEAGGLVVPVVLLGMWKPYEMYCLSRLDTYLEVPQWCMKTAPNLYSHVQSLYWDVGFLRFLERPWYLFVTSLFTSALFFYMLFRLVREQGLLSMVTGGISRTYECQSQSNTQKCNVFDNLALLPHAYVLIVNMVAVILFANTEINSRVASTCPFYFYAFSQLILETIDEMQAQKGVTFKQFIVCVALLYNTVVMLVNLLLFTVEIGFV